MKITASYQPYLLVKSQVLVLFSFEEKPIPSEVIAIDHKLNNLVSIASRDEKFQAKYQELLLVNIGKGFNFSRVSLVGLGRRSDFSLLDLQKAIGSAVRFVQKKKVTKMAVVIPNLPAKRYPLQKVTEAMTRSAVLADYQYTEFKTERQELPNNIQELVLISSKKDKKIEKGILEGKIIAEAINHARDYGNQPSNKANPNHLVKMAQKLAEIPRVRCRVLEKEAMEKLKMGGVLGVAQGAKHPPKFIILEYSGRPSKKEWIVLVGKGITFDSGGISIKPSEKMEDMKFDMSGGGAVIGAVEAIAKLRLPLNVVGLVPALENLPSGEAYKPGDVLVSASGKTIEVITTDAEGRIVLADALHYASRYKPKAIIDLATLTGFCIIALGTQASGLFGNNAKLIKKVKEASEISGERVWELPLWPEYNELLKSDVADLKNSGGKEAGVITGAAFLIRFVNNYPWAHLDIAGTAWNLEEKTYLGKGATGYGVQLLVELMREW